MDDKEMPNILQLQSILVCWREIDALDTRERERILSMVDSLVRGAKARQSYHAHA